MKEIDCIVAAEDFIARTSHAWNGEGVHPNTIIEGLRKLTHLPLISDMNALTLLVMKWRYMEGGSGSLASQNRKDAFRRCANDLERTMKLMQLPTAAPGINLPTPRNRDEAMTLAKLALAHLGVVDAHIDAAIARCVTDTSPKGVTFHNDGNSEAQFIADSKNLNCPACGGSGHVDDSSAGDQPSTPMADSVVVQEAVATVKIIGGTAHDFQYLAAGLQDGEHALYAAEPVVDLREPMLALYHAYLMLLRTGRTRILDLGGHCDSVEYMAESDPDLRAARAALGINDSPKGDDSRVKS